MALAPAILRSGYCKALSAKHNDGKYRLHAWSLVQLNGKVKYMSNKSADEVLEGLTFNVIRWNYGGSSAETAGERYKAKQQLLADILSLAKGLAGNYGIGIDLIDPDELEQALKDYFMGGDVGVDMGSSQDSSTPTAQGREAGNLNAGGTK